MAKSEKNWKKIFFVKTQNFCMGKPFVYTLTLKELFQSEKLLHLFIFFHFSLFTKTNK